LINGRFTLVVKTEILLIRNTFILLLFCAISCSVGLTTVHAQQNIFRKQSVQINTPNVDSLYFIGFWVDQSSVQFKSDSDSDSDSIQYASGEIDYLYLPEKGTIQFSTLPSDVQNEVLTIEFRRKPFYFPVAISQEYPVVPDSAIQKSKLEAFQVTGITSRDLFGDSDIRKSGSLTRGFTVGSNQDVSLQSGLRLDLQGNVTDDVEILATLTDESIPIQPDGTTQNLQEFDRVYIELTTPEDQLKMGDIDIALNQSQFVRVERRLQGIVAETDRLGGTYLASAAVSRGEFSSTDFEGRDGFQGPYRLTGKNGEEFIIVVAGTEKVFLNGTLLTRGETNDYIIDYGLGEVIFTDNTIISDNDRIRVEFQYLSDNFSTTFIAADAQLDSILTPGLSFGISYARESDNSSTLGQLVLSDSEIEQLEQAGDDPLGATSSGVRIATNIEETEVVYEAVDTVLNGQTGRYYQVSEDRSGTLYRIRFSRGGERSYERVATARNGIVYRFVGVGQGVYDTLRTLPKPETMQMFSTKARYKTQLGLSVESELAMSHYDENSFSNKDNDDNADIGYAFNIDGAWNTRLGEITSTYRHRFTGEHFAYFDVPEVADFERKWSLSDNNYGEQRIQEAVTSLRWNADSEAEVFGGIANRTNENALRAGYSVDKNDNKLINIISSANLSESENENSALKNNWVWMDHEINHRFFLSDWTITPFLKAEIEEKKEQLEDSLLTNSFKRSRTGGGMRTGLGSLVQLQYQYLYRVQENPDVNKLEKSSKSLIHNASANIKTEQYSSEHKVSWLEKDATERFQSLGRATDQTAIYVTSHHRYQDEQNRFSGGVEYDVNTDQKALLQETYIDVGPELGQFVWDDFNDDGIAQVDEFVLERTPNEGTYVRQYIPSEELIPSVSASFRVQTRINTDRWIDDENQTVLRWLRLFRLNTTLDVKENSTTDNLSDVYLLNLSSFRNDSTTLNGRLFWRTEARLFPNEPFYDVRLSYTTIDSKQRQAFGLNTLREDNYATEVQYRIARRYRLNGSLDFNNKTNTNSEIENRNYDITSFKVEPELQISWSRELQTGVSGSYQFKTDKYELRDSEARLAKLTVDMRGFYKKDWQFYARASSKFVTLRGETNSFTNFELTEGSGEGLNWEWSAQLNYRVSELIQSSISYDGRTITGRESVNTIRFVVKAVF